MVRTHYWSKTICVAACMVACVLACATVLLPGIAHASTDDVWESTVEAANAKAAAIIESPNKSAASADGADASNNKDSAKASALSALSDKSAVKSAQAAAEKIEEAVAAEIADRTAKATKAVKSSKAVKAVKASKKKNKVLKYDRKLIEKIGTQEESDHTICCPSFSCAYADAVLDGTVHDHEYYTCECCTWDDWGGSESAFRSLDTDEELLREAYDQISAGKPTVIHVEGESGEHWIALIGYRKVEDPDQLELSNFIALDPWDGKQINAADRYTLYGDGCEHISSRKVKKAK